MAETGGAGGFCKEDHPGHDIAILRRAVRQRWPMKPQVCEQVADEMARISLKRTTEVAGMSGPITVDNDRNQTAAARVFSSMMGQNQEDEHHKDRMENDTERLQNEKSQTLMRSMTDQDWIDMARQRGVVDRLPPRLRELAEKQDAGH